VAVDKFFDSDGVPRGIGNQVTAEFNLLYRFHSVISRRDEGWLNKFFKEEVFPNSTKTVDQLTPQEFLLGLLAFEKKIPEDPSQRTFGGLQRGKDGRFNDAEMVKIMKESMEDPAGLFGARMVPKALRVIEILGILQARKWQLASLNEMRDFFKLKRHESFEEVNPDPQIADLLRKIYDHPDMVEMYPGMFLEDAKPRLDPGEQAPEHSRWVVFLVSSEASE
jgi:Animal haem peroxidase